MKKSFILIFLLTAANSWSLEIKSGWNFKFEKEVTLACSEDEYFCDDFCDNRKKCIIKEEICRDCIGPTPYLTHVFNQLGKSIVKSEKAYEEDVLELLGSKNFASINKKSVYNHVDRFNSPRTKEKFEALCDFQVPNPVILFETENISKKLGKPKFLICGDSFFHMDPYGGVVLED